MPTENDSRLWLPGDTGKTFLNGRRLFGPRGEKLTLQELKMFPKANHIRNSNTMGLRGFYDHNRVSQG